MPKRRYLNWEFPKELIPSSVSGLKTSLGKSFIDIKEEKAYFELIVDGLAKPLYVTVRVSSGEIDKMDFLKAAVKFAVEKAEKDINEYENSIIPEISGTSTLYTYPEKY